MRSIERCTSYSVKRENCRTVNILILFKLKNVLSILMVTVASTLLTITGKDEGNFNSLIFTFEIFKMNVVFKP